MWHLIVRLSPRCRQATLLREDHRTGPSFSDRIEQAVGQDGTGNGLSLIQSLTVVRDVAMGLEVMQRAGVCHYDVKPDNVLSHPERGWVLIDPLPREFGTERYQDNQVSTGPQQDFLALGRTFHAAYLGEEGLPEIPEGYDLREDEEIRDVARFVCRLLGRGFTNRAPKPVPDARWVYREANRLLKAYDGQ